MFQYWSLDYDALPGATACERAYARGLRCLHDHGNWRKLRNLNRPALIELTGAGGERHHVVVSGLSERDVTLDFGGTKLQLPILEVDPYWFGEFLLLWRPPSLKADVILPGTRSDDVLWLRRALARVLGELPPSPDVRFFDEALKQSVMAFQRSRHISEDGIVGEQTLIQLNSALEDSGVPTLCCTG